MPNARSRVGVARHADVRTRITRTTPAPRVGRQVVPWPMIRHFPASFTLLDRLIVGVRFRLPGWVAILALEEATTDATSSDLKASPAVLQRESDSRTHRGANSPLWRPARQGGSG